MDDDLDHNQSNKKWKTGHVYLIDYGDGKTFKIGHTINEPQKRFMQIGGSSVIMPMHLVFSAHVDSGNAMFIENALHMRFDADHVRGEWFKLDFADLVDCYQVLQFFSYGRTKLYDRWFELVPDDWSEYLERGSIGLMLPHFSRNGEKEWNDFDVVSWFAEGTGGSHGAE